MIDMMQLNRIEQENNADQEKMAFLVKLAREIVTSLSTIDINKINDGVDINNFDEVSASLRNELARAIKPLLKSVKELKDSIENIEKPDNKIEVTNLKDFPESLTVKNLSDIKEYFNELKETIQQLKLNPEIITPEPIVNLPAPQVHVDAPIVNVAPTPVTFPDIDLKSLILALDLNLNKIRTNSKERPLAVRLSDGKEFINQFNQIITQQKQAFAGFSDMSYLKNTTGQKINPATDEGLAAVAGLVPVQYDYISLSPAALPTTVIYKKGGSSGQTVATLTITYSGSDIATVTRT